MNKTKYLAAILVAVACLGFQQAQGHFIIDPDPGGIKIFFDEANKGVTDFEGFVGANNASAPHVHIHTTGPVDTGSGFSTIKPVKDGSLTELIFTPADPNLFGDFSFRGQLEDGAGGTVTLTVQDNQGHAPQTFTFTGLGGPNDFARQGIVSLDHETIQSVTITSDFKEFKQVEISFGDPVSTPDGGTTVMLLGAGLAALGIVRRYLKKKTILAVLAMGALSCALFSQQAQAAQITGEIHFGGDVILDSINLSDATTVNVWISAQNTLQQSTVLSTTDDFAVVPFGTLADMAHPWIFDPSTPTPGLWSIPLFGFSFDLNSVTSVGHVNNSFLNVLAEGTIHGTGFDDTPGLFSFTVSNPNGLPHVTFAFAAETIAVPTPDGGTTVMLLGAALGALGIVRRYLKI